MTKEELKKEAEKYGEKDLGGKYLSSMVAKDKLHAYKLGQYDGFVAGAEFGYNKVNEWHYPSKGEYPEENLECLCIDKVWTGQTFTTILKCCDGVFIDSNGTPYNVIAWKEIVLPNIKESK